MNLSNNKLKYGYTTGTHTSAAFKQGFTTLLEQLNIIAKLNQSYNHTTVKLPNGDSANINVDTKIKNDNYIKTRTIKTDNDDIDVTKGCTITCSLSTNKDKLEKEINHIPHQPHTLFIGIHQLIIYAGVGVGIVTKKGLKVSVGFPAINPVPLLMIQQIAEDILNLIDQPVIIYCVIGVESGEQIAQRTANPKVGIIGGISILGTKGIVKPISAESYIDSIQAEISVANASRSPSIIYTIGNKAFQFANQYYKVKEECIIEVGNFIYESLYQLKDTSFRELYFIAQIGKMTKIALGLKNTHHYQGIIDFKQVISWLIKKEEKLESILKGKNFNTMFELGDYLNSKNKSYYYLLYQEITNRTHRNLSQWLKELNSTNEYNIEQINVLTLDQYLKIK